MGPPTSRSIYRCSARRALAAVLLIWLAACGHPPASQGLADADLRPGGAPEAGSGFAAKEGAWARHFMVAAAHPLATDAGYRILRAGGSAVDALIAVQMVLTLVEPQSSGLGGGMFLIHHDGKAVQAIDARETAPAAATPGLFLHNGKPMSFLQSVVGGRSVGTPGVVRGLALAHRLHGRLPWASLFDPAIELAEQGFVIGPRLATLLTDPTARPLRLDRNAAELFFEADGSSKKVGTVLRNLPLAGVFRALARQGELAFYEGPLARAMVDAVQGHATNPGGLSLADLAGYRALLREPLCFNHRSWRLCGMPPPSSGTLAIAQMLGMLEQRRLALPPPQPSAVGLEASAEAVHVFSELGRLAFADRARYVADPDFVGLPGGADTTLLDANYLRQRAALIGERSMQRALPGRPRGFELARADDLSLELPSTSHVSIADGFGNTLAMTSTIENAFGAQIMVGGFLLNNQLTDFSFLPEADGLPIANRVEPGKRPRSSMAPMLVFERSSGALVASLGSPGGSAIINYAAKVLLAMFEWDLDIQQAITLPNFGSRNGPTELELGRATPALVESLQQRGHQIQRVPLTSGIQGLQRRKRGTSTEWFGGADPRREGTVRGD